MLQGDNGGEYVSEECITYCQKETQLTTPYIHLQMGISHYVRDSTV